MKSLMTLAAVLAVSLGTPTQARSPVRTDAAKPNAALAAIVADPARAKDAVRDPYRHPAETLTFFDVQPDMTVVEYVPGGGWYTRILAPYLAAKGKLIGVQFPMPAASDKPPSFPAAFVQKAREMAGNPNANVAAYMSNALDDSVKGTVDRVLIFRMMHNMMRSNIADTEIKIIRDMLKPDGLVGIEQHRAKPDAPYSYVDGSKGYLRQSDVIAFMTVNGFTLVRSSEINANPKDTADYPQGVWTLPPNKSAKDGNDARYDAIGESDRMTLVFRKRP